MSFTKISARPPQLSIEGIVEYVYSDILPCQSHQPPAKHWFVRKDTLKFNDSAAELREMIPERLQVSEIGFWSLDGISGESINLSIGDHVKIKLDIVCENNRIRYDVVHEPSEVLVNANGEWVSAIRTGSGIPAVRNYGAVIDYPPLRLGWHFSSQMQVYFGDIKTAIAMWTGATGIAIECSIDFPTNPHMATHYQLSFASLPSGVLGRTEVEPRPHNYQDFNIWISNSYPLSAPNTRANANQYDFITIMVHELGHAIGLAHDTEEVMKPTIGLGETYDTVSDAEAKAVKSMYGL